MPEGVYMVLWYNCMLYSCSWLILKGLLSQESSWMSFHFLQQSGAKYWFLKLAPWYIPLFHERPRLQPPRKDHNALRCFIIELPIDVQDFLVWLPVKTTTLSTSFSIMFSVRPFGKLLNPDLGYTLNCTVDDSYLLKIIEWLIFVSHFIIHLFILLSVICSTNIWISVVCQILC